MHKIGPTCYSLVILAFGQTAKGQSPRQQAVRALSHWDSLLI